ncbi:hypothetical protein [Escherichia coli]|uniref:hypothetical protein n=1 Tax=Escherichia coli TaxID=562 RepID=UPI0012FF9D84|nr:hypothetical protein [Escherichia coli]
MMKSLNKISVGMIFCCVISVFVFPITNADSAEYRYKSHSYTEGRYLDGINFPTRCTIKGDICEFGNFGARGSAYILDRWVSSPPDNALTNIFSVNSNISYGCHIKGNVTTSIAIKPWDNGYYPSRNGSINYPSGSYTFSPRDEVSKVAGLGYDIQGVPSHLICNSDALTNPELTVSLSNTTRIDAIPGVVNSGRFDADLGKVTVKYELVAPTISSYLSEPVINLTGKVGCLNSFVDYFVNSSDNVQRPTRLFITNSSNDPVQIGVNSSSNYMSITAGETVEFNEDINTNTGKGNKIYIKLCSNKVKSARYSITFKSRIN